MKEVKKIESKEFFKEELFKLKKQIKNVKNPKSPDSLIVYANINIELRDMAEQLRERAMMDTGCDLHGLLNYSASVIYNVSKLYGSLVVNWEDEKSPKLLNDIKLLEVNLLSNKISDILKTVEHRRLCFKDRNKQLNISSLRELNFF